MLRGPSWGIVALASEVLGYAPLLFVRPQIWWPYDLAGWSAFFLFAVVGGIAVRNTRRLSKELQNQRELLHRTRDERIRLAIEEERTRVARDLHDVVAHALTVMVVQAGAARALADSEPRRAKEALVAVEQTGEEAIRELGSLLGHLGLSSMERGEWLVEPEDRDVASLVNHAIDAGLRVELVMEGPSGPLDAGLEIALFRIVQEALTNVRRHAPGARAWVEVRYFPGGVEIEVTDTGPATEASSRVVPGMGLGLVGIAERAGLFGGDVEAGPTPEGGFRVRARLPRESVMV
jgi:signal transduction histidine kinase